MKGVDEERSVSAGHGKASPLFAACRVGDARRVRAGRLGTFGLKPTLARSLERERLRFGGNLLSGPWAVTLAFAGQDAEEVASRPAAVWRICRGWQGNGWKGVLERAASIEEARPNCSQPAPLNGGCLRGMPLLTGGLHDPAFHRPYRRRACFSPYLPHLPRTGENLC